MKDKYIIPFFIPHKGCPEKCIFCDQERITSGRDFNPEDIPPKVEKYLSTIPREGVNVEIGFFGGTFTGLPADRQERLLKMVRPFIKSGRINGIRVSTRPDFIGGDNLELLKGYGVNCVELGVQSMSEEVLAASQRGYSARQVEEASRLIIGKGFKLGYQMMLGLPLSRPEDEYFTGERAVELGASEVRIYPLIVIRGTGLADMWNDGKYEPLGEEEAIARTIRLLLFFRSKGVTVIRCGLHPSEELGRGRSCLAGPFHPAFKQKVESRIFAAMLRKLLLVDESRDLWFNPKDEGAFFGFRGENASLLGRISGGGKTCFVKDREVPGGCLGYGERTLKTGLIGPGEMYDDLFKKT